MKTMTMYRLPRLLILGVAHAWLSAGAAEPAAAWTLGTPIVTYWCGPTLTDAVAQQMAAGGFNLVWCNEAQLDVAQRHGLRAQLTDGLLSPAVLDDPKRRPQLDALVDRVRRHPALYAYFITDEPSAAQFPALGRLVAYLRERDPKHLAYINLFPTYANNRQLGTAGDTATAYREHLRQYLDQVKPALISYDHYQFMKSGEGKQYFLNLALIRETARAAGVPFLNIVQAASWSPSVRVPTINEIRYLVYTTVAYGAQGISFYIYTCANHEGGIALPDGTPTPIYHALKTLNPAFVAMARELQPLRSLAVYHTALEQDGCVKLPNNAAFQIAQASGAAASGRGFLLGMFGAPTGPSHVVVVNLDLQQPAKPLVSGPGALDRFDATAGQWRQGQRRQVELELLPGEGKLVRLHGSPP